MVEETRTGIVRRTLEVEISPEELAAAFLGLNSEQQAESINRIGAVMFKPGEPGWGMQLLYVADDMDAKGWEFVDYLAASPRKTS